MKVLIVTEAINRKHGANGSLIDLADALRALDYDVYTFTTARNILFAWLEAFVNIGKLPKQLFGRHTKKLPNSFKAVFLIGSASESTMDLIKRDCKNAKLISFQTSNVDLNNKRKSFIENLDILCFQSPMQLAEYKNLLQLVKTPKMPKGIYVGATCNEKKLSKAKMINFGDLPAISIFGSIQPRKGQLEFCKIVEKYPAIFDRFQINFFGPMHKERYGSYGAEFLKILSKLSKAKYWGDRADYIRYLKGSDIILSYSSEEGLSTIVRESLFLGKLIIATNISGNSGTLNESNSFVIERDEESVISLFKNLDVQSKSSHARGMSAKIFYENNLSNDIFQKRLRMVMDTL